MRLILFLVILHLAGLFVTSSNSKEITPKSLKEQDQHLKYLLSMPWDKAYKKKGVKKKYSKITIPFLPGNRPIIYNKFAIKKNPRKQKLTLKKLNHPKKSILKQTRKNNLRPSKDLNAHRQNIKKVKKEIKSAQNRIKNIRYRSPSSYSHINPDTMEDIDLKKAIKILKSKDY